MRVLLHMKSHIVNDIPGFVREPGVTYADADLTGEQAGRLCYLSWNRPNPKTATNSGYLLNIEEERHYSVLGHPSVTIYVDGITRNCSHEIVRHRWYTFSEVSQRYVDAKEFWFATHPGVRAYVEGVGGDGVQEHMLDSLKLYRGIVEYLEANGYARKQARQAARHVLPGGTETKILMSGNLRAWRDFLAQRLRPGADAEIRDVALEVFKIMKAEFPNSFQDFDSLGMITTDRLIARALARYDAKIEQGYDLGHALKYVEETRKILNKGLWVLQDDPWEEDKIGSGI